MIRRTTIAAACAALAAGVLVAAPAEAATYGVTLNLSKSTADVGQKIGLSGKVSGSKAAKKKLSVQYRLGSGSWKTVKTVTTSGKATYATTFTVKTAGPADLRVVAPKKGSTKAGTSPTRNFTGYRWLWLSQQSHEIEGRVLVDTQNLVGGKSHEKTIDLTFFGTKSRISWNLGGKCDTSDIPVALNDSQTPESESVYVQTDDGGQTYTATSGALTMTDNVTTFTQGLDIQRDSVDNGVLIVSPRVHCSVNQLPQVGF